MEGEGSDRVEHLQAVLAQETESRHQQEELNSKLQDEYDVLLKKLAEAELHIDKLRLRANVDINKKFVISHHSKQSVSMQQGLGVQYGPPAWAQVTLRGQQGAINQSNDMIVEGEVRAEGISPIHKSSPSQQNLSQGQLDDVKTSDNDEPPSDYDANLSQLSTGYIETQASAESQHLSQMFQIRSLHEKIASLKEKLISREASVSELSDDLGQILEEHKALTGRFALTGQKLDSVQIKYKDNASRVVIERNQAMENELSTLAEELMELDGLLRFTASPFPNPEAPASQRRHDSGEASDDSLGSPSLPSKYLSTVLNSSNEQGLESHSPISDDVEWELNTSAVSRLVGSSDAGGRVHSRGYRAQDLRSFDQLPGNLEGRRDGWGEGVSLNKDSIFPPCPASGAGDSYRTRPGDSHRTRPASTTGDSRRTNKPASATGDSRRTRPASAAGDSHRTKPTSASGDSRRTRPASAAGDSRRTRPTSAAGDSHRIRPASATGDSGRTRIPQGIHHFSSPPRLIPLYKSRPVSARTDTADYSALSQLRKTSCPAILESGVSDGELPCDDVTVPILSPITAFSGAPHAMGSTTPATPQSSLMTPFVSPPTVSQSSSSPTVSQSSFPPTVSQSSSPPTVSQSSSPSTVSQSSSPPTVSQSSSPSTVSQSSSPPTVSQSSSPPTVSQSSSPPVVSKPYFPPAVSLSSSPPAVSKPSFPPAVSLSSSPPTVSLSYTQISPLPKSALPAHSIPAPSIQMTSAVPTQMACPVSKETPKWQTGEARPDVDRVLLTLQDEMEDMSLQRISHHQENRTSHGQENRTSHGQENRTSHGQENRTSHGQENRTSHGQENRTSHGQENRTSHGQENRTSHGQENRTSHGQENRTSHGQENRTSHGQENRTSHGQENRTSHGQENRTSHGQENRTSHGQENRTSHGQENRTSHGQVNRTSHGQENRTSHGQENRTSHGQENRTSHGLENRTSHGQEDGSHGQENRTSHGQKNRRQENRTSHGQQNRTSQNRTSHGQQNRTSQNRTSQNRTSHGQQIRTSHGQEDGRTSHGQNSRISSHGQTGSWSTAIAPLLTVAVSTVSTHTVGSTLSTQSFNTALSSNNFKSSQLLAPSLSSQYLSSDLSSRPNQPLGSVLSSQFLDSAPAVSGPMTPNSSTSSLGSHGMNREAGKVSEGLTRQKKTPKLTVATMDALRKELVSLRDQITRSTTSVPTSSHGAATPPSDHPLMPVGSADSLPSPTAEPNPQTPSLTSLVPSLQSLISLAPPLPVVTADDEVSRGFKNGLESVPTTTPPCHSNGPSRVKSAPLAVQSHYNEMELGIPLHTRGMESAPVITPSRSYSSGMEVILATMPSHSRPIATPSHTREMELGTPFHSSEMRSGLISTPIHSMEYIPTSSPFITPVHTVSGLSLSPAHHDSTAHAVTALASSLESTLSCPSITPVLPTPSHSITKPAATDTVTSPLGLSFTESQLGSYCIEISQNEEIENASLSSFGCHADPGSPKQVHGENVKSECRTVALDGHGHVISSDLRDGELQHQHLSDQVYHDPATCSNGKGRRRGRGRGREVPFVTTAMLNKGQHNLTQHLREASTQHSEHLRDTSTQHSSQYLQDQHSAQHMQDTSTQHLRDTSTQHSPQHMRDSSTQHLRDTSTQHSPQHMRDSSTQHLRDTSTQHSALHLRDTSTQHSPQHLQDISTQQDLRDTSTQHSPDRETLTHHSFQHLQNTSTQHSHQGLQDISIQHLQDASTQVGIHEQHRDVQRKNSLHSTHRSKYRLESTDSRVDHSPVIYTRSLSRHTPNATQIRSHRKERKRSVLAISTGDSHETDLKRNLATPVSTSTHAIPQHHTSPISPVHSHLFSTPPAEDTSHRQVYVYSRKPKSHGHRLTKTPHQPHSPPPGHQPLSPLLHQYPSAHHHVQGSSPEEDKFWGEGWRKHHHHRTGEDYPSSPSDHGGTGHHHHHYRTGEDYPSSPSDRGGTGYHRDYPSSPSDHGGTGHHHRTGEDYPSSPSDHGGTGYHHRYHHIGGDYPSSPSDRGGTGQHHHHHRTGEDYPSSPSDHGGTGHHHRYHRNYPISPSDRGGTGQHHHHYRTGEDYPRSPSDRGGTGQHHHHHHTGEDYPSSPSDHGGTGQHHHYRTGEDYPSSPSDHGGTGQHHHYRTGEDYPSSPSDHGGTVHHHLRDYEGAKHRVRHYYSDHGAHQHHPSHHNHHSYSSDQGIGRTWDHHGGNHRSSSRPPSSHKYPPQHFPSHGRLPPRVSKDTDVYSRSRESGPLFVVKRNNSSESELGADEIQLEGGGIDLKGAVRLARQLRRRSERMRGALQVELTKQGLL